MNNEVFERVFERIEYFYDIHMNSYHVKIANLAFEEYSYLFLEIIRQGGEEWLKDHLETIENKGLLIRILIFFTVIDLEWAKQTFKRLVDETPSKGSDSMPTVWNNFVAENYLSANKMNLSKINSKRKLGLKFQ